MNRRTTLLGCLLLCSVAPVARGIEAEGAQQLARQLAQNYPAGSIGTPEQADRALADATALHEKLQSEFDAERRRCEHVFLVTHCMAVARDAQRRGEQVVHRVTLEAHDLRRHNEARLHAQSRDSELRRQAEQERLRPEREQQATDGNAGQGAQ